MPPDLGGRPDMEWDQTAVGRWVEGVRERHVERRRLHHQLPLRRHHRTSITCLLWRELLAGISSFWSDLCFCDALTTFMPHLLLGKRRERNEEPTFQWSHRGITSPHISNDPLPICQQNSHFKGFIANTTFSVNFQEWWKNLRISFLWLFLMLGVDWVRRFVSRRQRQMRGDKMTNAGLSCDKSRRLSGLDIARAAAGIPFKRTEQAGHVPLKGFSIHQTLLCHLNSPLTEMNG